MDKDKERSAFSHEGCKIKNNNEKSPWSTQRDQRIDEDEDTINIVFVFYFFDLDI